jgi:hypothetical protein
MWRGTLWACLGLTIVSVNSVKGDHLTLKGGKVYEGQVLQQNEDVVVFRLDHGVLNVSRDLIASVDLAPPAAVQKPANPVALAQRTTRMPKWDAAVGALAKQPWATNLKQIPSTVIDKGAMRFVPYSSYRCGTDYEVNVYGDPDNPAGVEIGVYRSLLSDAVAKQRCIDLIASLLPDPADAAIVRALHHDKDLAVRDGLTFEVTPETAEDAYGGWWISVYGEKLLDAARATDEELRHITIAKNAAQQADQTPLSYDQSDMSNSRGSYGSSASAVPGGGALPSGTGTPRVYVRGYTRSNGTYVAPYTRAAPGYGSHGHK